MPFVRRVSLVAAASAAVFFLLVTAIDTGVVRVVGSPEPIKRILADSGIYESIITSTLEQAEQESTDNEISFGDKIVLSAAESTFSGQYLETTTNSVIDSLYRWLDNQTPAPDFKIDLNDKKVEFANKVASSVEKRVAKLPRCSATPSEFDAFSARCRPAGLSAAQAAKTVRLELLNSQDFLDDTVITARDIKSFDSNKELFADQLKNVPAAYQKFKASPLALGVISLLALAGVILLSDTRLKGVKHAGFLLVGTGLFLLLLTLAINEAVDNKVISQISLDNEVLQQNLRQLVSDLSDRLNNSFMAFGGAYIVVGASALGAFYLKQRKRAKVSKKR